VARAGRARREGARVALKLGQRVELRGSRRWSGSSSTAAAGGCSASAAKETEEQSMPEEEEREEGV
jgi:hypothetical protein